MAVERMDRRTRGELIQMDEYVARREEAEAWKRAARLAGLVVYGDGRSAEVARKDLEALVNRRLRQIGEGSDAA